MSVAGKSPTAALAETGAGFLRAPRTRAGRVRLFASPAGQQKVRRATDVVALVPALLVLGLLATTQPPRPFERALIDFLQTMPDWLAPVWGLLIGLLAVWLLVLVVATAYRRRWRMLAQAVLAVGLAVLVGVAAERIASGSWPDVSAALGRHAGDPGFPDARLAFATAALLTLNAHLVRPARQFGDRLLAFGSIGVACGLTATPGAVLAALLAGAAAAAGSRLLLGTSAGRPNVEDVVAALGELGIAADQLEPDARQTAGVVRLHAGDGMLVKIYGRDAYDNQLLTRFWRMLWYRDAGPGVAIGRFSAVEHEAFLTLLARNAGVPTAEVVTAGETSSGDALLVLRGSGTSLADLPPEAVTDGVLERAWRALSALAAANIAHLQLEPGVLVVSGDEVELREFTGATVAADSAQRARDQAQLLAATAVVVGPERAVRAAVAALGPDETAAVLPYLQEAAFSGPLRRALKAADIEADDLRTAAAEAVGAEPPQLVKLRRVTWASAAQSALLVLAATAVLSYLGQTDFDELRSDLEDAQWSWIVVGAVIAQLPRLAQAYATLGSVPQALPYGPVYAMQLATGYLNLALPSSLARMAISVRFFQRQGVPPATAVASGLVDSLANNVVQGLLLILLLLFSQASVNLGVSAPDSSGGSNLLWLLVAVGILVVVAAVVAVVAVPRVRHALVERLRHWIPQVRSTFAGLRSPTKLFQLIAGNAAGEILFATALGMMCLALGYHVSLVDLLVINLSVSLFASFIPIPGGIGVVEGGLMVGLSGVGVPQSAALAIAILYRLCTFYLPPIAGWFAMRWLTRNSYL